MRPSASAPSLADLRPASISLTASTSDPTPGLGVGVGTSVGASSSMDDDMITPRTRRIGNFARRQAGAGGYAAGAAAAPIRLLPPGGRKG